MRILFFIILSLFIKSSSYSAETTDCTKETSFLKKFNCIQKNLKSKLNVKQSEAKEKISETAKDLKSKIEEKSKN